MDTRLNKPVFAASIAKIPLSVLLAEQAVDPIEEITIYPDVVDVSGGGDYDVPITDAIAVTAHELLEDMLKKSGNTAYRIFSRKYGADMINNFYIEMGWPESLVKKVGDEKIEISTTTASEATEQLKTLLLQPGWVGAAAQDALTTRKEARYGIQAVVQTDRLHTIASKTGEYTCTRNEPDGDDRAYRNEVACVEGKEGKIFYAMMTSSHRLTKGYLSTQVLNQAGAEIASTVGLLQALSIGRRALL